MSAAIFSSTKVKILKAILNLNGFADILSGTVDPSSVATDALRGSLYLNTSSGLVYRKTDDGSSTNWTTIIDGTLADGQIFIGNASNVPTPVAVSGDISITNAGVTAYAGIVPLSKGGTNANISPAAGSVAYFSSTDLNRNTPGTSGQILTSGGTGAPVFITLLPLANGGTNKAMTAVAGGVVWTDSDSQEVTSAGSSGQILSSTGTTAPAWITLLPLANGGTNKAMTAINGGIVWTDADSQEVTAAGTAGQILTSGGAATPAWVTLVPLLNGGTNKAMTAANGGIVWTDADSMEVTAAGTAGQILTSGGAATPAWVTLVPLANGGTNKAMTAINGGIVWTDSNSQEVTAAGTAGQILTSGGAATPAWITILPLANGGTNAAITPAAGAVAYFSSTDLNRNTPGTSGDVLVSGGTGAPTFVTLLPLANGGTNKAITAAAGGLVWTDADSLEVGAAGTSGHLATSGGTGAPTWTTYAQPAWTITTSSLVNCDSVTAEGAAFQLGARVFFYVTIVVDPTITGAYSFNLSMPVASNFSSTSHASGALTASDAVNQARIQADATADLISVSGTAASGTSFTLTGSGGYRVI